MVRICDSCYNDYVKFKEPLKIDTACPSPTTIAGSNTVGVHTESRIPETPLMSVPSNWNWSTF